MSRRRRKGNPLLVRIILISVAVHIVVLPILAYFGAFKKIGNALRRQPDIVMVAPPPHQDRPEVKKVAKQAKKAMPKGGAAKHPSGAKAAPLQQRVVASTSSSPGGNGPSVVNPDKGVAPGTLPPSPTKPTGSNGNGGTGPGAPAPVPPPHTDVAAKPTAPTPPPVTVPPKPHVPVVTEVSPTYNPSPVIPDDLRADAMDATVIAQFLVSPDGATTGVKIVKSSGNDQLDAIALDTAKKWKFKPATRDGEAIESRVILHIEFEVQ